MSFHVYAGVGWSQLDAEMFVEPDAIRIEPRKNAWFPLLSESFASSERTVAFRTTIIAAPWANNYFVLPNDPGPPLFVVLLRKDRKQILDALENAGYTVESKLNTLTLNLPPKVRIRSHLRSLG